MASENRQQVVKVEGVHSVAERRYLVKETVQVPRGASYYTLPKGKTISSMGYDVPALKRMGVKLEEVTDPVA
jgi:hypothetical protein